MKYKIINKKKRVATMLFDRIGRPVAAAVKGCKTDTRIPDNLRNILIIRTAYLGDVIMTLPILKPLREKYPAASISMVTSREAAVLLDHNPYLDRIYPLNPFWFYKSSVNAYLRFIRRLRKHSFDLIIEARGDIRDILLIATLTKSRARLSYGFGGGDFLLSHVIPFRKTKHRIEYHLDLIRHLGCVTDRLDRKIYLNASDDKKTLNLLNKHEINYKFISAHPGARLPLKRWPAHRCAALYDKLIDRWKLPLVLLGAANERSLTDAIAEKMKNRPVNLAGELTLRELTGIIARSRLLICNDSAPMHMASAMETPTVAIFGPSKSVETRPYGDIHRVVEKPFACRYGCDESRCRNRVHQACMDAVSVDDVYGAAVDLMK